MFLSELFNEIKQEGMRFNTFDIPMDKEVHIEIKQRGPSDWYVEVNVKED